MPIIKLQVIVFRFIACSSPECNSRFQIYCGMPKELRSFIRETASWPDSSTYANFVGVSLCAKRQQMELLYVDLRPSAALGAYTHKVCIIRDNMPYVTLLWYKCYPQLSDYSINCNKFARRSQHSLGMMIKNRLRLIAFRPQIVCYNLQLSSFFVATVSCMRTSPQWW